MTPAFDEAALERIARATRDAEGRTSGEIVTYIVERSDDYADIRWKSAALGALLAAAAAGLAYALGDFWPTDLWPTLPTLVGAGIGYLVGGWAPLARWLIGEEQLEWRARQRAETAFLEEEVFATRDRTGILLFLALFEHRFVVLGDAGIHAAVEPGAWDDIVREVITGLRAGRAVDALCEAVEHCGELLESGGVERRDDDENELSDRPRVRAR